MEKNMKIKTLETIWTARDNNFKELICATRTFEDLMTYLHEEFYFYDDLEIHTEGQTIKLKDFLGKDWFKTLKSFDIAKINHIIKDITIQQVDLVEMIE